VIGLAGGGEPEKSSSLMSEVMARNPALLELVYLDADGRAIASAARDRPVLANLFTIPQSQWFQTARSGRSYHSAVQVSAVDQPYGIIALPAPPDRVMAARMHMSVLWDVISHIHFGKRGSAYVVGGAGQVIAHTNPEVVLAGTNIGTRPGIQALLQSPSHEWAGQYLNPEGVQSVGATAPVAGTDWIVVTDLPLDEAFAATRDALVVLGGGMALFGLVVIWVTAGVLRTLIFAPVERLGAGAARFGTGDLAHRIRLSGRDEISQVARTFDEMADHLRDQRATVERRNAELEGLYEISLGLTSNLDLDAVLEVVLASTFKLLPDILNAHVFLYGDDRLAFAASLQTDTHKDELAAPLRPEGLTATVARSGEPLLVPDARAHPQFAHMQWLGALAGIPLKIGPRVVGVMNIAYAEPHVFAEDELRLLRLLGDQAAIAIENARLYGQAQRELAERKQVELALRESESRYRAIVEDQSELICRFTPDGALTFVNQAFCRYYRAAREDLIGRSFLSLMPEEEQCTLRARMESLGPENPALDCEHRALLPGGDVRWQECTARAILDDQGRLVEFASVARDITVQREAEESLRRAYDDLEERVRKRTAELAAANAVLRTEVAERQHLSDRQAMLYEVLRTLSRELDPAAVTRLAVEAIARFTNSPHVCLVTPNEEGTHWVVRGAAGRLGAEVGATRPLLDGVVGRVFRTNEVQVVPDVSLDPDYVLEASSPLQSELAVPMRRGERLLGALNLESDQRDAFDSEEVQLVQSLAEAVSLALDNSRLYAAAQSELAERKRAEDQIRASLAEKEVLLKEIHHRVKNNLQVITSLLYLQSKDITDPTVRSLFLDSENRVRSIALVHERLYRSADLAQVNFGEYIRSLSGSLIGSYGDSSNSVRLVVDVEAVYLNIDVAIPCGLIMNELVSNCLKHAFPDGRPGEIRVELRRADDDHVILTVADDGVGFPKGLDARNTSSLGLQLVYTLTEQLGGKLELDGNAGATVRVVFATGEQRRAEVGNW